MPVKKEPSGRRSVQAEVEVPGSPEEVWNAIATGPGISSWFVPSRVEEREGGAIEQDFGPNMLAKAQITAWDPPRRFAANSPDDLGPGGPPIATEWTVEAKSGDTCVVRVVHSWFASTDEWDDQFEQHQYGWSVFFRTLRFVLTHFRGQPSAVFQHAIFTAMSTNEAWSKLTRALGIEKFGVGARVQTRGDAPRVAGRIEDAMEGECPGMLVHLEEPAPGFAHIFAMPMGGQLLVPIRFYLFGKDASEIAKREETRFGQWITQMVT